MLEPSWIQAGPSWQLGALLAETTHAAAMLDRNGAFGQCWAHVGQISKCANYHKTFVASTATLPRLGTFSAGGLVNYSCTTGYDTQYLFMHIDQHMPMGAKTAPLRQGLRYGTRLISWLLSSHFWLFHLHTSCFPSGAIKAVIVCRSLPSAAWQRLMLMMTSGMMASNTDPLE